MIIIRSIIFNILLLITLSIFSILGSPLFLFNKKYTFIFWKKLSIIIDKLTKKIVRITYSIEGSINTSEGSIIYAIRHESTWETLIMIHFFHKPIFILKKELMKIPFFGAMAKKVGCISIDRKNGARALIKATKKVEKAITDGHSIIIFPEGTRTSSGSHVKLKRGIAMFYKRANCPVVPVIHNSGKFWSKHSFIKKPGNISVKFLAPIPPGLHQDEFMDRLNTIFYDEVEKLKLVQTECKNKK